jgi:hypothetical protein
MTRCETSLERHAKPESNGNYSAGFRLPVTNVSSHVPAYDLYIEYNEATASESSIRISVDGDWPGTPSVHGAL